MKVENNPLNPLSTRNTEEIRALEKSRQLLSTYNVESKDKADVSDRARILVKARSAFEEAPDVRADRVDTIKQQVDGGSYEINYSDLANQLVNSPGQK